MINIYQPSLGEEELSAISDVFKSNWIGKGKKESEFVLNFAKKLNVDPNHFLSTSSCTEGLFQIFSLLNFPNDSEVIIPSIHFIGAANAIKHHGLNPVFCDVDKHTLNCDLNYIKEKVTPKTKAIVVLHYGGSPCDIENINKFCKDNNIILIEDNANSPFSKYNSTPTGTIGDFGVWSFDAMKILVTGDGGMIYCRNKEFCEKLKTNSYLGLLSESGLKNKIDKKWWEFDISSPGRRSIVNDIQSAIGIEQLKKVNKFISIRKKIHKKYDKAFSSLDWIKTPTLNNDCLSSYYMYHIQLPSLEERDSLSGHLRESGIYTTFRYYPLHLVGYYKSNVNLPNTEYAANHTLCIPLHQSLTESDVDKIIKSIKEFK